jgi:cyclic-di-GMP-binding protein
LKNSYFLVIPKQQKNSLRLKEFEEAALTSWLAELPTANVGLATRLMHDFIVDSNTLEMPSQLRLNVLEQLRPSILLLEDYLRSRLMRTGFPKEENEQKILGVLVSIEKEFAIGYWTVLKDLTHRTVGWFQGKNTALALQRCIKGLSSIVISHFIMGMPIPDWVWLDLHSLYKLSVKIEKNSIRIANGVNQASKSSSPEDCYLQILLLSLVDPTGLMQKEILLVDSFIETICSLVSLKSKPVQDYALQCLVFTDEDKPPVYQSDIATKKDSSVLYIDFSKLQKAFEFKEKLVDVTEARFSFSSVQMQKNTNGKLAAELLDYLEQRWAGVSLEGEPLFSDRLDRYIAIGLAATLDLQDVTDTRDKRDLEFLVQSESDRLLSCIFTQTGLLSVGSLVSFRKTDMPEHTRLLGVVDKVVVAKQSGKIIFGMKLLTPQFISVEYNQFDVNAAIPTNIATTEVAKTTSSTLTVKETAKNGSSAATTTATTTTEALKRGLFYSNDEQMDYLITDTFMLKDDDTLRIHMHHDSFSVTLKNRKNVGLGYWQFECIKIKEKKKHILPTTNKKGYDFI